MKLRKHLALISIAALFLTAIPAFAGTSPWCYTCNIYKPIHYWDEYVGYCGVTTDGVGWEFCLIQVEYECSVHTVCFAGDI